MILTIDMERRARSYLRASRILSRGSHAEYDAAAYLCGYAIEIGVKVRICLTLGWAGYPETGSEFRNLLSFKAHDLETLLHLSGREQRIKSTPTLLADWSIMSDWNPEQRYERIGTKTAVDAQAMTEATVRLLKELLP